MKSNTLLAVLIAAFVASTGAGLWLIQTYAAGLTPWGMIPSSDIMTKLCMLIILLAFLPSLIGVLTGSRSLTYVGAGVAVGFGVLGALYCEIMTQTALRGIEGPINFAVTAPSRAESLFCLSLGLFVAIVALGLMKLRKR